MNLNNYIAPLKKWWWLLLASALIAGISSLILALNQPPIYMARSTLVVGNMLISPNPNGGEFYLQLQLANTYADMASRGSAADGTMAALGLDSLPNFTLRAVANAPLIEILVSDSNPTRAMLVANELANQILLSSPTNQMNDTESQQFISDQLENLKRQINDVNNQLVQLQQQQRESTSARQIADLGDQILSLQERVNQLQNTYANFLSNSAAGASNSLTILERAVLPTQPINSNIITTVLLSIAVGLGLSSAGAYIIEYLDDSVKSIDDIKRILKHPIVGYIPQFPGGGQPWTYMSNNPNSPFSQSFHVLRANLDMLETDTPIRSFFVSSAEASDGKSTIATNLAFTLAQGDLRVVCIDADLHRPNLHHAVDYNNEYGLTDVLKGDKNLVDVQIPWGNNRLNLIPTGKTSEYSFELLNSRNIDLVFDYIPADVNSVVIDGPPVFMVESSILCTKVDCFILVVRKGYTKKESIKAAMGQLGLLPIKRLVVVLNSVDPNDTYSSKYYSLYSKSRA